MTKNLLKKTERLRHLAMLLAVLCGFAAANAQLSSDEINEAILVEGSVPVKWTNDAEHPWYVASDENGTYLRTPEKEGDPSFNSTLTFTYSSSYPTEITLQWRLYYYNNGSISFVVDGEEKGRTRWTDWTDRLDDNLYSLIIPAGSHTVQIISESENGYLEDYYYSGIRNLRVWECKDLESACLKDGSLPITFDNDTDNIWITENGYIRSPRIGYQELTSKISTTITIDRPSLFSFDMRNIRNYVWSSNCTAYIDGVSFATSGSYDWSNHSVVLSPGSHVIEFVHWQNEYDSHEYNGSEIRNVRLDQTWYNVSLNNPGELAVKILQALEGKNLQDAELVKINGSLNSDDWSIIRQLSGAKAIDLTGSTITEIPDEGMRGLSVLSTVMLPSTLKKIGNWAFYEDANFYQVEIPASVEEIGWRAWQRTPLRYINFASDSRLRRIGHCAFSETNLLEFIMPNTVTEAGRYEDEVGPYYDYYREWNILTECQSLKKLHLSEGLTVVPRGVAYRCTALEEVNIPAKATAIEREAFTDTRIKSIHIPETVTSIGYQAFAFSDLESLDIPAAVSSYGERFAEYCHNLKEVKLSSHCWNMNYDFNNCTSLTKVTLPCATPPTIYSYCDPFYEINKSGVELFVPDFAVEAYKADPYWYQFTNIKASDDASINDYWAIRGNLTLDANHVIQGSPTVEMMEGGILILDANSSQNINGLVFNTSESNPSAFLSRSNDVKVSRAESRFYVPERDHWYFFSPVTDVKMSDVKYPATESWVIRYYDGARRASENSTSGNWINVPSDGTLKSGQGYIIQAREAGWLYLSAANSTETAKFAGSNQVTFELADNTCETEANAGWNFVANPYPTYYDIYYIDMQAPITIWDGNTYRAYSLNDGDRGDDTFVLRPMQPFFVQKSSADLKTGMPLVGRQVNTTVNRSRAPRPVVVDENRNKLNLELFCNDNETADDYTRVVLNEAASMAYETVRDASKFMSMNAEVAQLYTLGIDGHPMAINERPYEDGNVPLGVLLPATDRTYRIAALRADRKAWLYDSETGIEQDLTDGDYIFTASKTGIDNKRFSIRFAPSVNAVEGMETTAIKVNGNVGSISVTAPANATVAVYGTDGSVIATATADNGSLEFAVAGGVYVVKVNGESFKTIVK